MLVFLVFIIAVVGVTLLVDEIAYLRVVRDPDYARCASSDEDGQRM